MLGDCTSDAQTCLRLGSTLHAACAACLRRCRWCFLFLLQRHKRCANNSAARYHSQIGRWIVAQSRNGGGAVTSEAGLRCSGPVLLAWLRARRGPTCRTSGHVLGTAPREASPSGLVRSKLRGCVFDSSSGYTPDQVSPACSVWASGVGNGGSSANRLRVPRQNPQTKSKRSTVGKNPWQSHARHMHPAKSP